MESLKTLIFFKTGIYHKALTKSGKYCTLYDGKKGKAGLLCIIQYVCIWTQMWGRICVMFLSLSLDFFSKQSF